MATETIKVVVIEPDGDPVEERFERPEYNRLKETIGGWLEAIYPHPNVTMWCDEEGKLKDQPVNSTATWLWWFLQPEMKGVDHLRGTVVVTGGVDSEGDALPVDDLILELMTKVVGAQSDPNTATDY